MGIAKAGVVSMKTGQPASESGFDLKEEMFDLRLGRTRTTESALDGEVGQNIRRRPEKCRIERAPETFG